MMYDWKFGCLAGVWQKNSKQKSVWDYVYDTKYGCNFLWKSGSMTQNVWHKKGDLIEQCGLNRFAMDEYAYKRS